MVGDKLTEYASLESAYEVDTDPHISGTIRRGGDRTEFWLSAPRPKGFTIDEWENIQEAKWSRIFRKENV